MLRAAVHSEDRAARGAPKRTNLKKIPRKRDNMPKPDFRIPAM